MEIKLHGNKRPIFYIPNNTTVSCLLDTGAIISVFTKSEDKVKLYFPSAKRYKLDGIVAGFNYNPTIHPVYIIDDFVIGDIHIKNFIFVVMPDSVKDVILVLAGPVLNDSVLELNHKRNKLSVIPNRHNMIICGISTIDWNNTKYVNGNYSLFQNEIKQGDAFQSSFNKMKGL